MLTAFAKKWLGHRYFPAMLAVAGVLMMLPALKAGLGVDDLIQRVVELKPSELPSRIPETGIALESGTLPVVLRDLFGFSGRPEMIRRARNYGLLPWWTREDLKAALWRPLTAFTHWVDYQLYPNSPELMHAQNIGWFAAILFLVAWLYRRLIKSAWVAGIAAVFFLLDKNTYFPVMFVANRGFVMSLCFGLLCLYAHHRWRSTGSRAAAVLSALSLAASLFSNEAGASTLAFLLAYAFFMEPAEAGEATGPSGIAAGKTVRAPIVDLRGIRGRLLSLLPAVLVVVLWRLLYQGLGFGVEHVGAYIDPAREPLRFAGQLGARAMALLGGQLTCIAPDIIMAMKPSLQAIFLTLACVAVVAMVALFIPLLRRDQTARFWFAAMVLAAIPAATVVPLSKNLGYVAVAAFGLIATFIAGFATRQTWVPQAPVYRGLAWALCGFFILAHVPGAIVGRVAAAKAAPSAFGLLKRLGNIGDSPGMANQDILVVNTPCQLAMMAAPFTRAYDGLAVPKSLRTMAPGCTDLVITRTDDRTLVIQAQGPNLFHCGDLGWAHSAYIFSRMDRFVRRPTFQPGQRTSLKGLEVEVLEVDPMGLPRRVAFHFDSSLDSPSLQWRCFDWLSFSYKPFEMPRNGQSVSVPGPRVLHPATGFSSIARRLLGK